MTFNKLKEQNLKQTITDINTALNNKSNKIIKAISHIEDLNEALKLLQRRIYEEVDYYNPTLLSDNIDYEKILKELIKNKKKTIGATLNKNDKDHLNNILKYLKTLNQTKQKEEKYLDKLMTELCPNVKELATTLIGAKLIKKAGSLRNLAFMTSSLIQVLGAEKALFRHLKLKSAAPKHGLLINHPLVIDAKDKGKAAKLLANKLTLAARTDFFSPGKLVHKELLEEIKTKLK